MHFRKAVSRLKRLSLTPFPSGNPMSFKYLYGWMLFSFSLFAQSDVLTIRADAWYPMNGDPHAPNPGYMIDLAKVILEPEGIEVEYQISPWKRAVYVALSGNIDCIVGATTEEAKGLLLPKQSWGIAISGIYIHSDDHWRVTDLEDLLNRKTGLVTGYEYGGKLDKFFEKNKGRAFQFVSGQDPLKLNLSKLLANKIDGILETTSVMDAYIKANDLQGKVINGGEIGPRLPRYIACTEKYARTRKAIQLFNTALPRMRANGELANILGAYGLSDWEDQQ